MPSGLGVTLLLVGHGSRAVTVSAFALIAFALVSELIATLVYLSRRR